MNCVTAYPNVFVGLVKHFFVLLNFCFFYRFFFLHYQKPTNLNIRLVYKYYECSATSYSLDLNFYSLYL